MKYNQKTSIKGIYKITECDCSSKEAQKMCDLIKAGFNLIDEFIAKFKIKTHIIENLVPDVGLQAIAENLVNASPSASEALQMKYIAVGTGTTTPTGSDTTLETEVFRDTVDSQERTDKTARNSVLIGYSEANGYTLSEVGAFAGDASATVDSGLLFSKTLISPTIAKTSSKVVFIEITHTFSNA